MQLNFNSILSIILQLQVEVKSSEMWIRSKFVQFDAKSIQVKLATLQELNETQMAIL